MVLGFCSTTWKVLDSIRIIFLPLSRDGGNESQTSSCTCTLETSLEPVHSLHAKDKVVVETACACDRLVADVATPPPQTVHGGRSDFPEALKTLGPIRRDLQRQDEFCRAYRVHHRSQFLMAHETKVAGLCCGCCMTTLD